MPHKTKNYVEYHHPDNQYSKNSITYEEESLNNNSSPEESFTKEYSLISNTLNPEHRESEDFLIDSLTIRKIEDVAKEVLTDKEYQVLQLSLTGLTITEIARKTGVTRQSVSEMKIRAENKLKKYLS